MASVQKTATTLLYASLICATGCFVGYLRTGTSFGSAESSERWRVAWNVWELERTDTYTPKIADIRKRLSRESTHPLSIARIQEELANDRASARNWLLSFWGFVGVAAAMMIVLAIAEQKRPNTPAAPLLR